VDVAGIAHGDAEGSKNEVGALQVDLVAHDGVDGFHERDLDGLRAFEQSDGMDAGLGRRAYTADHTLVEVTEFLVAHSGRTARVASDFDVGADFDIRIEWHQIQTSKK